MRYKLLLCTLVLLTATPVAAQEFSPIVVETGKPTPSIVKSGEPFKIIYRASFFDTVIISEEQMQPESIALDKIEVIGLDIKKERISNDTLGFVNVWDFTYTFRIIQPEKGVKKVPPFNFIWVEKKAGVTVEESKDKEKPREMPTEEVGVNYVSSVVKPPVLDIRDTINFVSPVASGMVLRRWAYGVIGTSSLAFVLILFGFFNNSKSWQVAEAEHESKTETAEDNVGSNTELILSPKQARKKFLRELQEFYGESRLDLKKRVRLLVRSLLLSELSGTVRSSMSANEIYAKLSGLDAKQMKKIGWKYAVMLELARRLKGYQEDLDSGTFFLLFKEERELREIVSGLKFHNRAGSYFRSLLDRVLR